MKKSTAIVIGAGIGGIATAARLAKNGYEVTVLEKEATPGGRCNQILRDGHRFDIGPTLFLMPEIWEETFASLLLMRWEPEKNLITYANAGHCRPVLVTASGANIVEESDMILGLDSEAQFTDSTLLLPPGSALVTYTDGLMEQRLRNGEMVGEKGILRAQSIEKI